MEIETTYVVIIIVSVVILLFYTYTIQCDNNRYKQVIDSYLEKPKSIIKKVTIKDPKDNKDDKVNINSIDNKDNTTRV